MPTMQHLAPGLTCMPSPARRSSATYTHPFAVNSPGLVGEPGLLSSGSMWLTAGHENARSALECASFLTLSRGQLAGPIATRRLLPGKAARELAGPKRQQATALQNVCGA